MWVLASARHSDMLAVSKSSTEEVELLVSVEVADSE